MHAFLPGSGAPDAAIYTLRRTQPGERGRKRGRGGEGGERKEKKKRPVFVCVVLSFVHAEAGRVKGIVQAYHTVLLQYKKRGPGKTWDEGGGGGGAQEQTGWDWRDLREALLANHPPPSLHRTPWRGIGSVSRKGAHLSPRAVGPSPQSPPFTGQGPAPLGVNTVSSRGPGARPFPYGSPSV